MNRLQWWQPKPLERPQVDVDLQHLDGLTRSTESIRYSILSFEFWVSPNGQVREWLRHNARVASWLPYNDIRGLRDRLVEDLGEYMGPSAIADSVDVPSWRGNIMADKEKMACRADRRRH